MKVLLLSQGRKIEDQLDFDRALRSATCNGERVELYNVPFISCIEERGETAFFSEVLRINQVFRPNLVFFQFFHGDSVGNSRQCIGALHASENRPLVFGSMGDLFETGWRGALARRMPKSLGDLAASCDAFFPTSMGCVADALVKRGAKNVVFLPHAFNLAHFNLPNSNDQVAKKCNVTMVGSPGRIIPNPRKCYRWLMNTCRRYATAFLLKSSFGNHFRLYGNDWTFGLSCGPLKFDDQIKAFEVSRIGIDAPAPSKVTTYYASDRPFFIAGSGTPLVMRYTPRFEKILKPGVHVHFAKHITDIPAVCKRVLVMPREKLDELRRQTIELVGARHTVAKRMDTLLSVFEAIRAVRSGTMTLEQGMKHLRLWHFLPDVDLEEERKYAIANWVG